MARTDGTTEVKVEEKKMGKKNKNKKNRDRHARGLCVACRRPYRFARLTLHYRCRPYLNRNEERSEGAESRRLMDIIFTIM